VRLKELRKELLERVAHHAFLTRILLAATMMCNTAAGAGSTARRLTPMVAAEFVEMIVGVGAAGVRDLFK
jgi:hypothetical protein